jgi:hypothetical protein
VVDKTYGYAAHGCMVCCGVSRPFLANDPLYVTVGGTTQQDVWATDACSGNNDLITSYYSSWSTGNTQIATANVNQVSGVAVGSTTNNAYATQIPTGDGAQHRSCPYFHNTQSGPVNVKPHIYFGGTDITNNTESVVVGQQIALSTQYTLPSGITVQNRSWSVAGTTIGGYTASNAGGAISQPTFNQDSTTFYWVYAGNSLNVTFTLNLSDGSSPSASATFNVSGVGSPSMTAQNYGSLSIQTLTGCSGVPTGPWLEYGNYTGDAPTCPEPTLSGTPGIKFIASGTQPSSGAFKFVQLINSDNNTYTTTGGTETCYFSAGLDKEYPYATGGQTIDGPALQLLSSNSSQSRSFRRHDVPDVAVRSSQLYFRSTRLYGFNGGAPQSK